MNILMLVFLAAIGSPKVDVTVACCPLAIVSQEAARYAGGQFGGNSMSAMKDKNKDGVISANDPVFSKLRTATVKVDGTATIENRQLVLQFPPGTDMSRLKIWVDGNGDGTMSPELAAKLGLRIDGLDARLKPGNYQPAAAAAKASAIVVRIPLGN